MATCEEHILTVAENFGIENPRIEARTMTEKGDNYMGELCFLKISGGDDKIDLVYKAASKSANVREKAFMAEAFKNEVLMYKEVFPMMLGFQEEKGVLDKFDKIAKCYAASDENLREYLIFENLNTSGYTMWNRKVPMNKEHVVAVFKAYAKFHATAASLSIQQPERFGKVLAKRNDVLKNYTDDESKLAGFDVMTEKIKNHYKEAFTDNELIERFSKLCENTREIVKNLSNLNSEKNILLHGDCWCNNILFKYTDPDKIQPDDIKLIDWQMIRIGPAVCDLSSFLFTCGSKHIFEDLDELLEIYHQTFVTHCKNLGTDSTVSLEDLKEDWIKYANYGLIVGFILIKVMVSDSDEAPDFSKSADSGGEIIDAFNYESKHDAEYYSRLGDVIIHCYNRGVI